MAVFAKSAEFYVFICGAVWKRSSHERFALHMVPVFCICPKAEKWALIGFTMHVHLAKWGEAFATDTLRMHNVATSYILWYYNNQDEKTSSNRSIYYDYFSSQKT